MSGKLSQTKIIYDLLLDGEAHSTFEMVNLIKPGGGLVRISERIREIRKKKDVNIIGFHDDKNFSLYWYQLLPPEIPLEEMPEYDEYNLGQHRKLI